MAEKKELQVIELRKIVSIAWQQRKTFYKVLSIVFVLSSFYILCIPRTYSTNCELAPEMGSSFGSGTLGSIASSFGFDLSDMETNDAITPLLYPDLMDDNQFVANLFSIEVTKRDGSLTTNYYDYLRYHQESAWWNIIIEKIKQMVTFNKEDSLGGKGQFDPYMLSRVQDRVVRAIRSNIKLRVDKKTGVITINVKDQDPLICRTIADSVSARLQLFITDYRTNKARIDLEYYEMLTNDAKADYDLARQKHSAFADANSNVVLQSYLAKLEDLENDMQLKYNAYTVLNTQRQQAMSKVQERTPAFTVLKGAEVPIKASGPKRMIFVAAMLFLAFFATTGWVARKELHFSF